MSLCFVVPAHGRIPLAHITLRRLAEVCRELDATAVIVACDNNLLIAQSHGLHALARPNEFLGRKFNDGLEYAAGVAEYVMPLGNDDLITSTLVEQMLELAGAGKVVSTARMSAVAPDGGTLAELRIPYPGGAGPRVIPSSLIKRCGGRPAEDTRQRALDTSIKRGLGPVPYVTVDSDPLDLVDVKTTGENLNTFEMLLPYQTRLRTDVRAALAERHPEWVAQGVEELYP